MKAMRFKLPRNRTIASTCGISIEFKKNEFHLVPPDMFAEVIAAGGVSEHEIPEPEEVVPGTPPTSPDERQAQAFRAFDEIIRRGTREDFTGGGAPHASALSSSLGWQVNAKERDAFWTKYQQARDAE